MSKVLVNESSLTGIANAIRSKNGTSDTYKPSEMAAAIESIQTGGTVEALDITANGTYTAPDGVDGYNPITVNVPQDGSPPDEAFVIKGNCDYRFAYDGWNWFISTYGNRITTQGIAHLTYMFYYNKTIEEIPFELNVSNSNVLELTHMFNGCERLKKIPKINNCRIGSMSYIFGNCHRLRNLPEDIESWFDWSYVDNYPSAYGCNRANMFYLCRSLRSIPMGFLNHGGNVSVNSNSIYNSAFNQCYVLDEIVGLPLPHKDAVWTDNIFYYTFTDCYRLKNMTFALSDGQPYVMQWKNQTLDFTGYFGRGRSVTDITTGYNSGITTDKEVTDDATYQALKDDPDWFTTKVEYSRYNHDSAVATINSLPDTSAYLAANGGTNTIKFKGAAGSATDGGAINTLTEEEIAVAAAKGWTVTLV